MASDLGRFQRIREIFAQAIDQTPDTRPAFLADACGADTELRREVESLLAAADSPDHILDAPTPAAFSGLGDDRSLSMVGQRIGQYEITRIIGFGGMGAVYEAHRADDEYRKRVAIKLIKRGLETDLAMRRFRHERQILASLEHRNIAALLDGGVTEDGRPYFVLEYVEGSPITQYCNRRRLTITDRLQLFRQVVGAVQHAHRNLVVHRDIKPGNILVADDGTVKLLDFGIAKILGEDDDPDHAPLTRGGLRALTPEYASPEMIRGQPITIAADIYSLGVVLFELVAGRRPFRLADQTLAGVERIVCEEPAPKPSAVASDDHAAACGARHPPALRRSLTGDVDSIILMALKKEADRRYPSADAMSEDLKRHLDGLPVAAERDWLGYRAGKFVRRNAVPVAIAGLLLVSLVGGVIFSTLQTRRANRERDKAATVTDFIASILASPEPSVGRPDITVAELLDSAMVRAQRLLADQPEVEALVVATIGHSYRGIGRYESAESAFRSVLATQRKSGANDDQLAVTLNNLGTSLLNTGRHQEADSLLRLALNLSDGPGGQDSTAATVLDNLGGNFADAGEFDSAEVSHRRALTIRRRLFRGDNEGLATSVNNLAVVVGTTGRYAEAESLHREAAGMLVRLHGERHPAVASVYLSLASILDFQGKPGSDSLFRRTIEIRRELLGPEHPDYAWSVFSYCLYLVDQERYREAVPLAEEVLALRGKTLSDAHPAIGAAYVGLGRAQFGLGNLTEAETAIQQSIAVRKGSLPPTHWVIASSEIALAEVLLARGQTGQALKILERTLPLLESSVGPDHPRTKENRRLLALGYQAAGRPDEATKYQP